MNSVELTVEGMPCGSCVKHVKQALQAVPGVTHVEVNLASGRARVDGDMQAGGAPLIAAWVREDYTAVITGESAASEAPDGAGCQSAQGNQGNFCCR